MEYVCNWSRTRYYRGGGTRSRYCRSSLKLSDRSIRAREEAEHLANVRADFLAKMSHEIRPAKRHSRRFSAA
ncbi:hypothetical protein O9993_06345 [Vibrio lentus]|nr:hypothetical protein [Vibrio lentus]